MISRVNYILLSTLAFSHHSYGLTLDQALKKTRASAPRLEQAGHQYKSKLAAAKQLDGAFDSTFFAKYEKADDRTMQNSTFSGDRRTQRGYEFGIRRFFGSGTSLQITGSQYRNETLFDSTTSTGVSSAQTATNFNPAHSTAYEINLSQELWRNFWAKEVRLQEQTALVSAKIQKLQNKILAQRLQAETESLYWNLVLIKQQISIAKKLVRRSKDFASQMSKRVSIGRADGVDEAAAASQVVAQEDSFIELGIMKENLLRRLESNIDPTGATKLNIDDLQTSLSKTFHKLPAADSESSYELGLTQRFDLAMNEEQKQSIIHKRDLASEEGKPSLSVFGLYKQNGIATEASDAYNEAKKSRNPLVSFGVQLEISLGNTKSASGVIAAVEEAAGVASDRKAILNEFKRDLRIAFTELDGSKRRLNQARKKIRTFQQKQRREQAKVNQARSDQVSVIRYEMEVLAAKNEQYLAQKRMRDTESQIKYLLHAYPTE